MYRNKTENTRPFSKSLKVLKLCYIYPKSSDLKDIRLSRWYGTIIWTMWYIVINGSLMHIFTFLGNNQENISEDLAVGISGVGLVITGMRFIMNSNKWTNLFRELTDYRKFGKPPELEKTAKLLNKITTGIVVYGLIGVGVYGTTTFYEADCPENRNRHFTCHSLSRIWMPFKVSDTQEKFFILFQFYIAIVALTTGLMIYWLVLEATVILLCHFNSLKIKILDIFSDEDEHRQIKKQRFCIEYHIEILRLGKQLGDVVKGTHGHISLVAALLVGSILYQVTNQYKVLGGIFYLLGNVTVLFMLCYSGQLLRDASLSTGTTIYESEWYNGSNKLKKVFVFALARCQKPIILMALPAETFCFQLFTTIINASFSYLTLLQRSTTTAAKN